MHDPVHRPVDDADFVTNSRSWHMRWFVSRLRGVVVATGLLTALLLEPAREDRPVEAQAVQNQHQASLSSQLSQAQTFQVAVSGPLTRVGLALGKRPITPGTATVTVQIRTTSNGQP